MRRGLVKVLSVICCIMLTLTFFEGMILAKEKIIQKKVKVAFFPMDGYNERLADGTCTGMDVDYLDALCDYTNWKIEYVQCESWNKALQMLSHKQVDLVGSAQYSQERAEIFDYADLPSGYTFGIIAVRRGCSIAYEDFSAMKDITYGLVESYIRKDEFFNYLKSNGIKNPKVKEYTTTQELYEAFEAGEVDAYTHTFTELKEGQRIIGRFAPRPFYYITYKGNDEVLSELNQAIVDLKINQPIIENSLLNKYYESKLDKTIVYSTAEKEYIEKKKVLTVGFMDSYFPVSYVKDSTIEGIGRNVMEDFSRISGLKINYILIEDSESAIEALKEKKIDILCYSNLSEEQIQKNNFRKTDPYIHIPIVIVADENVKLSSIKKVAVVRDIYTEAQKSFNNEEVEFYIYDNQQQCLQAIENSEVDVAICDGYLADYLLRKNQRFHNLEVKTIVSSEHDISMLYSYEMPSEFVGILDKTVTTVSEKEVNEYVIQNNAITYMSIKQFIENNSQIIIVGLVFFIIIITMIGIHMLNDSRKIQKLMYKDFNMNIWNLNYLTYEAAQKLPSYGKPKHAVVTINIAQFRLYNTLYGKEAGQKLLDSVVNMISHYVEDDKEIYARDQGDRFVLFITYQERGELMERLKFIKKDMENQIYKETANHMTIVIGSYLLPDDSKDLQVAISNSNLAMEAARDDKVNSIVIYDDELERSLKEEHKKEQLLNSVDFQKDFVAFYQAKVDIRTEQIVGAEALVRFKDPTCDGMIRAPYFFVPYYEKTGKITEIDFYVLENVCKMLRRRLDQGKKVVTVSVNFSRHHFMKNGFSSRFEAVLDKYDIPKELIEVEITETLVVEELHQQSIKETLEELKEKGIRLSIDDFGSGYSSLGVFEQIPAAVIKLDRSFLLNQEDRDRQVVIMKGIVHMAGDLEAQVVCEGVENDDDVELMKEIGAFIAQGYKYSKPIPEDEFEAKLDSKIE